MNHREIVKDVVLEFYWENKEMFYNKRICNSIELELLLGDKIRAIVLIE